MQSLDLRFAERLAALPLACIHREYPNKISHVLNGDGEACPPRELTPAFYGCYDWHSAVHGHWLLVRLLRFFPDAAFAPSAREPLRRNLTAANIRNEVAYLEGEGRASFERPYGLAWLLQLCQELQEWSDPLAAELRVNLRPLEDAARNRLSSWLPKLPRPVRTGEHSQSAFAMGLMLDYADACGQRDFRDLVAARALHFFAADRSYSVAYEPSGEDFLSPGLAEADLMRRVLSRTEFSDWLTGFLPELGNGSLALAPVKSPDPSDPKFSHLDGLNLSRAWMLSGIADSLADTDPLVSDQLISDKRRPVLLSSAEAHARAGLASVSDEHYVGSHWLGTFAGYLLTRRGLRHEPFPCGKLETGS
ncbi:MAG TPA: DUF2891 domain-containing protein [Candidatus Angelobacter sp.]|nr:DUF2891 domain-containing protein [Candidatus Angelobacter sp.]